MVRTKVRKMDRTEQEAWDLIQSQYDEGLVMNAITALCRHLWTDTAIKLGSDPAFVEQEWERITKETKSYWYFRLGEAIAQGILYKESRLVNQEMRFLFYVARYMIWLVKRAVRQRIILIRMAHHQRYAFDEW